MIWKEVTLKGIYISAIKMLNNNYLVRKFVFLYETLNYNTMKTRFLQIFWIVLLSLVSFVDAKSQDKLNQVMASIKEKVQDVPVDKVTYKQSIEVMDESKGEIGFSSEMVDEKGKTSGERFEFYLPDIDKNTIIRKTSGKKLFVSLSVNNNQKFIKHLKEGKVEGYTSNIEILLSSADAAQDLIDLFKTAIPLAASGEKIWKTSTDALSWLKDNINKISPDQGTLEQSFSFGEPKEYFAGFTLKKTDQKGVSTEEKFEFNILDINVKNLVIKVSGTKLSVSVETNGKEPYIRYSKNSEQQNYENNFEIIAEDVYQARNIISAFSTAVEKSKVSGPDFTNIQKALDFIAKNTTAQTSDKKTIDQKIIFTPGDGTKAVFTYAEPDSKGKTVEERSEFYLNELDPNTMNFKVSGKKITIVLNPKNKAKFIKYYKDNTLQDFQNDVSILTPDIETSRAMVDAFKAAIKGSETQPATWKSIDEAIKYLTNAVTGQTIGSEIYKLSFSSISSDPLNVRYAVGKTDSKGATMEQLFEFYPYMLDPGTIKITTAGKYLNVEASVNSKEPFVKVLKEGRQQSYDNGIEIMAFDVRQAQGIAEAIKYLAGNSKPKDKVWSDKQSAVKFITDNVGDLKGEGREVKQKIELTDNDPCKLSLTVSSTDDKGKTTDEIFEFSLKDLNKQLVSIKVSGKTVNVILPCKNKEKLVKVYKNGAQQAWGTDAELEANDVETARNIAEAFRSAITQCEK